jgi:hypothetical protein
MVTTCSVSVPTIKASGLPKGLVLTDNHNGTATVSGTPTTADFGPIAAAVTASVKGQTTALQTFTVTVDNSPVFKTKDADLVHTGTAFTYPVTTSGGYPTPTITTASTLPGGVALVDNGNGSAALEGTPTAQAGGTYTLTIVANSGVTAPTDQTFTLVVDQAPTLSAPASDTVAVGTPMIPVTIDYAGYPALKLKASSLPKGLTMVNNLDGTATISGTPLFKVFGNYTATILAANKAGTTSATIAFTVDSSPEFTSKSVDLVHTGTVFTYPLATKYGYPTPTITTSSPLPGGVSLVDNGDGSGSLTGSPDANAGGVYTITIDASTGVTPTTVQTFTLTVYQAPTFSGPTSDTITGGVAMAPFTINYAGYPALSLKASGLPKGLTFVNNNDGTATISGTPLATDPSSANVTVTAVSKGGTIAESITITIAP